MRKLCFALATVVLSTGAFVGGANAMTLGGASRLGAAIKATSNIDQVRHVCTHFWNGRRHRNERCAWVPNHRRHHHFNFRFR